MQQHKKKYGNFIILKYKKDLAKDKIQIIIIQGFYIFYTIKKTYIQDFKLLDERL